MAHKTALSRLQKHKTLEIPPVTAGDEDYVPDNMETIPDETPTAHSPHVTAAQQPQPLLTTVQRIQTLPLEFRNLLAGGCAGMVAKSVVAPLDRIKILYQVSNAQFHFSSLPTVASNIIRTEGLSALWQGNTATMIRVFPYSGIQFMIFDRCKGYFLQQHERGRYIHFLEPTASIANDNAPQIRWGLTPAESLMAGMAAGTVSVILTYPLDLTRAQLAVYKKSPTAPCPGFYQVLADNYKSRGIVGGLFRGITPTLTGILPYAGISFALNEQTKREIHHLTGRDLTTIERMQSGAFAGLVAQTVTYPIEVVRRRMQTLGLVGGDTAVTNLGVVSNNKVPLKPPTNWMVITSLYAEQGVRGFFKGVTMNWMKGPIAFSISFTTFDTIQRFMESEEEQRRRLPTRSRSS